MEAANVLYNKPTKYVHINYMYMYAHNMYIYLCVKEMK